MPIFSNDNTLLDRRRIRGASYSPIYMTAIVDRGEFSKNSSNIDGCAACKLVRIGLLIWPRCQRNSTNFRAPKFQINTMPALIALAIM